jgi:hypothetical protein
LLEEGGITNMQDQPKPAEQRAEAAQRKRQARQSNEDAFKGGTAPKQRLVLKSPWRTGFGRLWNARRAEGAEE